MSDSGITIYHNPDCATSRNALAMIEAAGYAPRIIEYRTAGWTRALLDRLLAEMGATPRAILRAAGTAAADLGLLDPAAGDEEILAAMLDEPILVNRPIVTTAKGTMLCRPSERVLELLDRTPDQFVKKDGDIVRP